MSKYSHSFISQIISLSTLIFLLRWKLVYVLQVPFSFSFTLSHYFFFHSLTHCSYSLFLFLGNSCSPTLMLFFFNTAIILLSLCWWWFSPPLYIEFFSLLLTIKNVTGDDSLPFFLCFIFTTMHFFKQDLIPTFNAID